MRTKTETKKIRNGYFRRTYQALPQLDDPRPSLMITLFGLLYVAFYTLQDYIPFLAKLDDIGRIVAFIIIIALPVIVFFPRLKRDALALAHNFTKYVKYVLPRFLIFFVSYAAVGILIGVVGHNGVSVNQEELNTMPAVLVAIMAMFYAPLMEETVYRGLLRWAIKGSVMFIIVSALIFGYIHVMDSGSDLYQWLFILQYAVLGAYDAYLYVRTNNIFTSILNHFLLNSTVAVLAVLSSL